MITLCLGMNVGGHMQQRDCHARHIKKKQAALVKPRSRLFKHSNKRQSLLFK